MRTTIILLSLLLLIWIGGSSYVYVCKIRKDCCPVKVVEVDSTAIKKTIADSLAAVAKIPAMQMLYFDFDKSTCTITPEDTRHFELYKQFLAENPDKKLLVTGHSDTLGPDSGKEKVSSRRAKFAKDQLIKTGITPDEISTMSESDHKPLGNNLTSEGRAKNRRVEIIIQ